MRSLRRNAARPTEQPSSSERPGQEEQVSDLVRRLSSGATADEPDRRTRLIAQLSAALTTSARAAGTGAVASGRWLSDLVEQMAPHLTIRDLAALQETYQCEGAALAEAVIRSASRS